MSPRIPGAQNDHRTLAANLYRPSRLAQHPKRLSCLAGDIADLGHLPEDIRPGTRVREEDVPARRAADQVAPSASLADARRLASDEAERAFLERGLREVGGTVTELARRCEMNRSHLQMLLKKHGLHSRDFRPRKV